METYLVGGAVRDELMGLQMADRDWVVVGATPSSLLDQGYRPVGQDFPVFLHPSTNEEYALARTERKNAPGYAGFVFNTDTSVTLEEDLLRRDLTINAMARDSDGRLIDPYNGQQDLQQRVLRHVSPAFAEDPVRVLRVAKFMSRYAARGFRIADETMQLMQTMVKDGEVAHLVAERVWKEMHSALGATKPRAFIEALYQCDALEVILPEVHRLFGVPQRVEYHPEIDSGLHTLMVLDQATSLSADPEIRFSALCHDLGKGTTPADMLPSHHGHAKRGEDEARDMCKRLKVPKRCAELAQLTARYHLHSHRAFELKATTLHKLFMAFDVSRRPERFEHFLLVCLADARGRGNAENSSYPQADYLRRAATECFNVDAAEIARSTISKRQIKHAIHIAQISALKKFMREQKTE